MKCKNLKYVFTEILQMCFLFEFFIFLWSLHLSNSIEVCQIYLSCQTSTMTHINMMYARQRRQWLILTVESGEKSFRQHLSVKKPITKPVLRNKIQFEWAGGN